MAGSKRKRGQDATAQASTKQPKQDGQKAVAKDIDVPIDEGFKENAKVKVYIDSDAIIYDASLNQTNIGKNANKFYRLQLLEGGKDQYYTHTRWGRVGEYGQVKTMGAFSLDDAMKEFNKKFKDKSGLPWDDRNEEAKKGKYTFIEKSYESDDDVKEESGVKKEEEDDDEKVKEEEEEVKSKLPLPTQRLVELIFNENHFNSVLENIGYNNDKLPLGKLGKATLTKGFEHLKELASLIKHPKLAQNKYQTTQREALADFTERYYSTIPHVFGRNTPPIIDNPDILQREVAMLDTLSDMEIANKIMKTTHEKAKDAESVSMLDKRFAQLGLEEMTPLDHKSTEYHVLKDYLINTAGHTHNVRYRLQDIFRVERKGEEERFQASEFANRQDTCRRLLWHGSRTTNFGGILSQGLRIAPPEAPVSGYAFGKGIYLADISTKSANYCMPSLSGGHGLLLLCEAELGRPMYEVLNADGSAGERAREKGCIATMGVGRTVPQGWVDAGGVREGLGGVLMPDFSKPPGDQTDHPDAYLQYNEYIAYDVAQIRLRYLIRVAM